MIEGGGVMVVVRPCGSLGAGAFVPRCGRGVCELPSFFFFLCRRKTKVSDREFDPRWLYSAYKSDSIEHGEIAVHVMKC